LLSDVGYTGDILLPKEEVLKMKNMLLAGTALLTIVSGSAMAADMRPARAPI
jgi:hypothetical protein